MNAMKQRVSGGGLILAPGVSFDAEAHEYRYRGRQLSGVTGTINAYMGRRFPAEWVEEHRLEGVHVHQAVSRWLNREDPQSVHPGVLWVTRTLGGSFTGTPFSVHSEVLVSDRERYASAVDIVGLCTDGLLELYDIKKGRIDREYVSWQLGVYKYLIEAYTVYRVRCCTGISLSDQDYYPIIPKNRDAVRRLLYGETGTEETDGQGGTGGV
jgi:hypothetical protein